MSIDEEMYCADNIMVAHYNMNQVVIYLTSTIGNVHNISINQRKIFQVIQWQWEWLQISGQSMKKTPPEEYWRYHMFPPNTYS